MSHDESSCIYLTRYDTDIQQYVTDIQLHPRFWPKHWNKNVIILTKFLSLVASDNILTMSRAASDKNLIETTADTFQWKIHITNIVEINRHLLSFRILVYSRADSRLAPSQWETSLQSNTVAHWLDANLESALYSVSCSCLSCRKYCNRSGRMGGWTRQDLICTSRQEMTQQDGRK